MFRRTQCFEFFRPDTRQLGKEVWGHNTLPVKCLVFQAVNMRRRCLPNYKSESKRNSGKGGQMPTATSRPGFDIWQQSDWTVQNIMLRRAHQVSPLRHQTCTERNSCQLHCRYRTQLQPVTTQQSLKRVVIYVKRPQRDHQLPGTQHTNFKCFFCRKQLCDAGCGIRSLQGIYVYSVSEGLWPMVDNRISLK